MFTYIIIFTYVKFEYKLYLGGQFHAFILKTYTTHIHGNQFTAAMEIASARVDRDVDTDGL
jgi:hypothetical protein